MNSRQPLSLRSRSLACGATALAAVLGAASLAGCGHRGAPIDPNLTWRYGVPQESDRVVSLSGSGGSASAGAPLPAASAVPLPTASTTPSPSPTPAPVAAAPASEATAPPAAASASTGGSTSGGGSAPAMKGAYKVVPVANGATIRGVCKISGDVTLWKIKSDKDNEKGCGEKERATERLILGEGGAVANCVVRLAVVKAGKDFPEPMRGEERSFLIDQKGCRYVPHVDWLRAGTQVAIGNDDGADHNIHSYFQSLAQTQFNVTSAPGTKNVDLGDAYLEKPGLYILKCDIHPWMSGSLFVAPHPYYDVTSATAVGDKKPGEFVLSDVPEGEYDLVAWHEGITENPVVVNGKIASYAYGPEWQVIQHVAVKAGETKVVDFTVPAPK